jgi:predicted nucleic acid-binding protein
MVQVVHRTWQSGQFLAPAPVYLDSSVTVAWLTSMDRLHARATAFIGDHLTAQRELHVSMLALDETMYRLLKGLVAQSRGVPAKQINLGRELKQNQKMLSAFLPQLRLAVGYVLGWATLIDGQNATVRQVLDSWLDRCGDVGGPHDALHLSLAEHSGSNSIVTGDMDFRLLTQLPTALQVITI